MKIVPEESTKEMLQAGQKAGFDDHCYDFTAEITIAYKAMHAAAPEQTDLAILPKELTAENGMKKLLIGEFSVSEEMVCPECDGCDDECDMCSGDGLIYWNKQIPWTTIKDIYRKIVDYWVSESQ